MIPRIVITPGEPAGIGPDILIQMAQLEFPCEIIAITNHELLSERARALNLPLKLSQANLNDKAKTHIPGSLKIIDLGLKEKCIPGKLNKNNAPFTVECLNLATELCLNKKADALVTGPLHKANINKAGINFTGHTEFLKEKCNAKDVLMLFVIDNLKVALVTTHLPLKMVSKAITEEKIINTTKILHKDLKRLFGIENPKILVAGLNPHAGEDGLLGNEEIKIIHPALLKLKEQQINIDGPLPADTIFTPKYLKNTDAWLSMYHDQALPLIKYLGFDRAVNVTLGLPIIRTSVDHGTACDLAGTNSASPNSLIAATKLAIEFSKTLNPTAI